MLHSLGGWPMAVHDWDETGFEWQETLVDLTKKIAISPLILMYVYLDRKNSNTSVITVSETQYFQLIFYFSKFKF